MDGEIFTYVAQEVGEGNLYVGTEFHSTRWKTVERIRFDSLSAWDISVNSGLILAQRRGIKNQWFNHKGESVKLQSLLYRGLGPYGWPLSEEQENMLGISFMERAKSMAIDSGLANRGEIKTEYLVSGPPVYMTKQLDAILRHKGLIL